MGRDCGRLYYELSIQPVNLIVVYKLSDITTLRRRGMEILISRSVVFSCIVYSDDVKNKLFAVWTLFFTLVRQIITTITIFTLEILLRPPTYGIVQVAQKHDVVYAR